MANLSAYRRGPGRRKPTGPAAIDWSHPLARGLAGCFLHNEAGGPRVLNLVSGAWATLASYNASARAPFVAGAFGGPALDFTTLNQTYYDTGLVMGPAYSWVTWFRTKSTNVYGSLFTRAGLAYTLFDVLSNQFSVWDESVSGGSYGSITQGVWSQAVEVRLGDNLTGGYQWFQNGTQYTASQISTTRSNANSVIVGSRTDAPTQSFDGSIDHTLLYNRALSAPEVAWLAREPFAFLQSPASYFVPFAVVLVAAGAGSAGGAATAAGVGAGLAAGAGSATGLASASGVGSGLAAGAGSATGLASASGVSAALSAAAGTADGVASASGLGASLSPSAGSADGLATASGVGAGSVQGDGSAAGLATASGVGASLAAGSGSAGGLAAASGTASALAAGDGSAAGLAAAVATGSSLAPAAGTAAGLSAASASGAALAATSGAVTGLATASGAGSSLTTAAGSAAGLALVAGVSPTYAPAAGSAAGSATASGVGACLARAAGSAVGSSSALGGGLAVLSARPLRAAWSAAAPAAHWSSTLPLAAAWPGGATTLSAEWSY